MTPFTLHVPDADIRRWKVTPCGGHFAAWERPVALAGQVQAFFRELR